jgi:hypothetical protein
MKIKISDSILDKAYGKAFEELYTGKFPWFSSKELAEEWAGDVLYEFLCTAFETIFEFED